ncbi:hypothetical protein X744_22525 [Mesorhizobium sp. LNJC372A00]|nr:hypothetical protein X745_20845 [Mesorhizobium sp. LNJC374B00]ESY56000.1 hypothetical protein X744_22525 [Mesorhizobium sp. LNJC372A00]
MAVQDMRGAKMQQKATEIRQQGRIERSCVNRDDPPIIPLTMKGNPAVSLIVAEDQVGK